MLLFFGRHKIEMNLNARLRRKIWLLIFFILYKLFVLSNNPRPSKTIPQVINYEHP